MDMYRRGMRSKWKENAEVRASKGKENREEKRKVKEGFRGIIGEDMR